MILVLDASTLINLANGEVLGVVLTLPGSQFLVSSVVRRESKTIARAIDTAVAAGRLGLIDDNLISAALFRQTKRRLKLDDGETECIIAADNLGASIACDDGAARAAATRELGAGRVTGSIGLLRQARQTGSLTSEQAYAAYRLMVQRGGYLPDLPESYF